MIITFDREMIFNQSESPCNYLGCYSTHYG